MHNKSGILGVKFYNGVRAAQVYSDLMEMSGFATFSFCTKMYCKCFIAVMLTSPELLLDVRK